MQTFLPYVSFKRSAECLDYRRLGKQRVEAFQIHNALTGKSDGWKNHPASIMWRGYQDALAQYMNVCIEEWISRGYNNSMKLIVVNSPVMPNWLGNEDFHASHRSNLLRKDPIWYGKFGWTELNALPYIWPK